jgi:gluconokinase
MIILMMGVAGAGKTTIGRQLANELGWRFCDADAFHAPEHIEQLRQGIPLTDEDRRPWLARIHAAIGEWVHRREQVVLACSVLKAAYRAAVLAGYGDHVRIVYLKASRRLLQQRLTDRTGHFMGESLLTSQFNALEEPSDAEALAIDAAEAPTAIIGQIRSALDV